MTKAEAMEVIASILSIEQQESWTEGEPSSSTVKSLERIKDIAVNELAWIEQMEMDEWARPAWEALVNEDNV